MYKIVYLMFCMAISTQVWATGFGTFTDDDDLEALYAGMVEMLRSEVFQGEDEEGTITALRAILLTIGQNVLERPGDRNEQNSDAALLPIVIEMLQSIRQNAQEAPIDCPKLSEDVSDTESTDSEIPELESDTDVESD